MRINQTTNINGCDKDFLFEKTVEEEWKTCVSYLIWLHGQERHIEEGRGNFSRCETMQRYWEDRLRALISVIQKEKEGWLESLKTKYCSGIFQNYLDEMLKV